MSYAGVDLATYGLHVTEYSVPEMAGIVFNKHSAIYGDSEFTTVNYSTRAIRVSCTVVATTKNQLQSYMDSIKGLVNPILTDKVITIDGIDDRRFVGRMSEMTTPTAKGRWAFSFRMTFQCMAGLQSIDETNAAQSIATNPDTLTIPAPSGNVSRIPAELYIRNGTGAQLTSETITLANDTSNESIVWKGTIPDGYWLKFGTLDANGRHKSSIELSTTSGADPEALTYTTAEIGYQSGDWARLKGGAANDITITGISTGTFEYTYRDRYL